jgi:hypothetical protein
MTTVTPPEERECERCGRRDVWDEETDTWVIETVDGDKRVGNPHCLHEWNITGEYNPFEN